MDRNQTLRWAVLAVAAATIAGCVEEGPGSPAVSAGGENCPALKSQMDRMVAQGKTAGKEYTAVLDRYLAANCQNR